jgi:tRNA(fMet)-specific endonuclease VapC
MEAFERFCGTCQILPLTDDVVVRAADIYADLKRRGEPIGDADILIGATAAVNGLAVVTNNESHLRRIRGLQVENWLRS